MGGGVGNILGWDGIKGDGGGRVGLLFERASGVVLML